MNGTVSKLMYPDDLQELEKVSGYSVIKITSLQKKSKEFSDKGTLQLWWDSKIAENDPGWWKICSLKITDREYVKKELEKYQKFYEELSHEVCNIQEQTDTDCIGLENMISNLKKKLLEMTSTAKHEINATTSSTLYKLHKSFIAEHQKLKEHVKSMELVVAKNAWKKSKQTIDELQDKTNSISEKLDKMEKTLHSCEKKLSDEEQQKQKLLEINEKMRKNQEELIKSVEKMKQDQLAEASQKQEELMECIKQMEKEQSLKNDTARQQQEELLRCIKQMEKEQSLKNDIASQQQEELLRCIKQLQQEFLACKKACEQEKDNLLKENSTLKMKLKTMSSHPGPNEKEEEYFILD